jgi:hypothetical protein
MLGPAAKAGSRQDVMQRVVDALWDELSGKGVSWVGFYQKDPDADEMTLGTSPRARPSACTGRADGRTPLGGR